MFKIGHCLAVIKVYNVLMDVFRPLRGDEHVRIQSDSTFEMN